MSHNMTPEQASAYKKLLSKSDASMKGTLISLGLDGLFWLTVTLALLTCMYTNPWILGAAIISLIAFGTGVIWRIKSSR